MDQTTRDREMETFERMVYPVWAPIFKRHAGTQARAIDVIHQCDGAIYDQYEVMPKPLRQIQEKKNATQLRARFDRAMQ